MYDIEKSQDQHCIEYISKGVIVGDNDRYIAMRVDELIYSLGEDVFHSQRLLVVIGLTRRDRLLNNRQVRVLISLPTRALPLCN